MLSFVSTDADILGTEVISLLKSVYNIASFFTACFWNFHLFAAVLAKESGLPLIRP
jgi:hypothetical protein